MLTIIADINHSIWINASAGCGKTTLLIKRLLSLLIQKQKNIVCITFTKAAANEMRNRLFNILTQLNIKTETEVIYFLKEYLNYSCEIDYLYIKNLLYKCDELVKINTFHSFCLNIMQDYNLLYQDIAIQDNAENNLFNLVIDEFIKKKCVFPNKISQILTENKLFDIFNNLINDLHRNYYDIIKLIDKKFKDQTSEQTKHILTCFGEISKIYREKNKNNLTFNAIIDDFINQQLWNTFEITANIEHILVDEAQDTNLKQWYIIAKLCEEFFVEEVSGKSLFVVGDNKQSIYGFQGANPNIFNSFYYIFKSQDFKNKLLNVEIKKSYRSAPPILNFVDKIFSEINLYSDSKQKICHDIHREDCPGYVEIHPLIKSNDTEEKELILAKLIVNKIKEWIEKKRIIPAKNRVVQPSDIAVLVAHRTVFINYLNQELHKSNIAVNFIGKVRINDNEILKLLIAIGNFFIYKYDEISLISILKSPIFCYKDEDIFQIKIADISINLYEHLVQTEIGQILENWLNFYGTTFEIYTNILSSDVLNKLRNFYSNEFNYYLNIFLDNALKENSIYKFLEQISKEDATFNINTGSCSGVTISTVHGSKGLEYPIVFIADSNYVPVYKGVFVYNEDNIPFWYTEDNIEYFEKLKEHKKQEIYYEHLRLLYVALTRAEDELYIFGTGDKIRNKSWYEICIKNFQCIGKEKENGIFYYSNEENYFMFDSKKEEGKAEEKKEVNLNLSAKIIKNQDNAELRRGKLIHKILENIFYVDNKQMWLNNFLENFALEFTDTQKKEIKSDILNFLIKNQKIDGKPEVEIIFEGKLYRIDLINITTDGITIIDYKTNKDRQLTEDIKDQLTKYKIILQFIYPSKEIKTKVIWV
jgi:ATP-dependent helicase/nuclease subunit A